MILRRNRLLIVLATILVPLPGLASTQCDAYFKFDGNLSDSTGGHDGQMIAAEGATAKPLFVEGHSGQALRLNGVSAMRALLDLSFEICPQVTFTAWIRVESTDARGAQYILSTGGGSGPGLHLLGINLVLDGTGNGLWYRDAIRDKESWFFVAGVFDYEAGTYRLHWRSRIIEGTLSENRRLPDDALWVGAANDKLSNPVQSAYVDELRIVGRTLDAEQLAAVQRDTATAPHNDAKNASTIACSSHAECATGTYCALDGSCHPDDHAPMDEAESAVAAAADTACDPVRQQGCGPGEKCASGGLAGTTGRTYSCVPDGTVSLGGVCSVTNGFDDCVGGTYCSDGACRAFLDTAPSGPTLDLSGPACDPALNQDCGPGEKCASGDPTGAGGEPYRCVPDGTVALGGACAITNGVDDCVGGTFCSGGTCKRFDLVFDDSAQSYEACGSPGCGGTGDSCVDIIVPTEGTSGSMCTRSCTADSQCGNRHGFTGACYSLSGSAALCYQRCDRTADCSSGNVCITTTLPGGLMDGICVPDNAP